MNSQKSVTPQSQTPQSQTPQSQTPSIEPPKNQSVPTTLIQKTYDAQLKEYPVCNQVSTGRYIYSVFHSIMALVAIYLSFRCNKGFSFGPFLLACSCPYIYIIYILATQGTCGILEK